MRATTNVLFAAMFATACSFACSPVQAIMTVGVYDENVVQTNTVDLNATGSSLTAAQFTTNVAAAYALDLGGVIDARALGSDFEYGITQSKTLRLAFVDGTNVGVTVGPLGTPISNQDTFASLPDGGFDFTSIDFAQIINGLPNEHVVEFGVTVLSAGQDFGTVRVEGRLNSGGTMVASRTITEAAGVGDTFFGLTAPATEFFTGFSLRYFGTPSNPFLWFDDIGFRTAPVVPEPTSALLIALAAATALLRRRL